MATIFSWMPNRRQTQNWLWGLGLAGVVAVQSAPAWAQVSFSAPTSFVVGGSPRGLQLRDLNGDADIDIATANFSTDNVSILRNNGAGSFGNLRGPENFAAGDGPRSIASGDIDGDGDLDLATANSNSDNISVLLNNGRGRFGLRTNISVGTDSAPIAVAFGDVDADGDLDIVTANGIFGAYVIVLKNNGTGGFTQAGSFGAAGAGAFPPSAVALGDLDGDGDLDAAVDGGDPLGFQGGEVSLFFNDGTGRFNSSRTLSVASSLAYPNGVTLGDVDSDGDLDILVPIAYYSYFSRSSYVSLLVNNGSASFSPPTNLNVGINAQAVALGDLDQDGDPDLVVANYESDNVSVLQNNGGSFAPAVNFAAGNGPTDVGLADVNGDGDLDIVVANQLANTVSVLQNLGS